jgi:hypothetical protein
MFYASSVCELVNKNPTIISEQMPHVLAILPQTGVFFCANENTYKLEIIKDNS